VLAAAGAIWFALVARPLALGAAIVVFGLGLGAATTASFTDAGRLIPAAARGAGFGALNSATLSGLALSPVMSGALAGLDLRMVFAADVAALIVVVLTVGRPRQRP
jgi:hypothetical protein